MQTEIASTRVALIPETLPAPGETADADEFLRELMHEKQQRDDEKSGGYRVVLYNDDNHSVDEVVLQIQKATGYDLEKAFDIMWEAHTKGRAICFRGERGECHRVARVLRQIRLQVEVDCD
jgi:ATP-dependent Clp protease adapter protein ClpS